MATAVKGWDELTARLERLADDAPLALGFLDLDGFEGINDREGREAGDRVLERVEDALRTGLPKDAVLARVGGDAWAAALPRRTPEDALLLLDGLRRGLAPIRASVGIAGFPEHVEEPGQLPAAADQALHRAKRERGDRCAIFVEERMVLKSNYYPRAQLARLATLADRLERTEASLLREALGDLLERNRDRL